MNSEGPNPGDSIGGTADEERIGELINEYFDRREKGEALSAEAFLAQHPEHAAVLQEHLVGLDLLAGMGGSSGGARTIPVGTPQKVGGSSAETSLPGGEVYLPKIPGYEIHKQIGRGGMGVVFKATQRSTKRVVALKLLLEGPFAAETTRKRFEREVALAAALRHSNIIPIYDSGEAEGRMYYAMEYVHGSALHEYLREHPLDPKARLRLFLRICSAISHAHQRGVVHRDLKPANILVDSAGEPHLLDFGLAKAGSLGDAGTSITAQILGTPAYMSPEQASGDPTGIDTRTDVYSLGVVLYESLTGKMPYETNVAMGRILHNIANAEPVLPSRVNGKLDSEVCAILLKSIEKRKENRYQSIDGMATDIQRYIDGQPIFARPPDTFYLLRKAVSRHRSFLAVTAAILVVALGGWLLVRQQSRALAVKEQKAQEQIQAQEQEKRKLEETLKVKQASLDELTQRESARIALDQSKKLLEKKMGAEGAEVAEVLTRGLSEVLAGKDPASVLGELASRAIDGAQPKVAPKKLDSDTAAALDYVSRRPADSAKPGKPTADSIEDLARLYEAAARVLRKAEQASSAPSTTTQSEPAQAPAATQPGQDPA